MDGKKESEQVGHGKRLEIGADNISVNRYGGTRYWAVWVNDELLAVTVYKKGAVAIRDRLSSMTFKYLKTRTELAADQE